MFKILILNGPNMNMLGLREKDIYGALSLGELESYCVKHGPVDIKQTWFQSNSESEIINKIQEISLNHDLFDGLIINPAAFSHYSIAILDALKCFTKPKIEVHLSDITKREEFRRISLTSLGCDEFICGMGEKSYIMALNKIHNKCIENKD